MPSEKILWLLEGPGLDYESEKNMDYASDLITREVERYARIQERIRLNEEDKDNSIELLSKSTTLNAIDQVDSQNLLSKKKLKEIKSALLLQSMYNMEAKHLTANNEQLNRSNK